MARITREQFNKWSAQAQNGFNLDLKHYVVWSEKRLVKTEKLQNGDVIEFNIEYRKEFETKTNEHGCRWNVETGRYIPELCITRWHPTTSGCYASGGYAKREDIGEPQTSKKYNVLCKLSAEILTDNYMPEIA